MQVNRFSYIGKTFEGFEKAYCSEKLFRLKEYSERLMFYNPLEYGRKAEDVLWRKVFYQIIQLVKQNRKVCVLVKYSSWLAETPSISHKD